MTQVSLSGGGFYYPSNLANFNASNTQMLMDAATEKAAMIGRLFINGRPAGAKTLSTGTIQFRTAVCTFANAGTSVDIGIQGVATATGPLGRPDGTYTVKTTVVGGGGGITTSAWNTVTMSSGSASLTHGDLIAVVWDMTAVGGADAVRVQNAFPVLNVSNGLPTTNVFLAGAWGTTLANGSGACPNVAIVFDDGTLGWIDFGWPYNTITTETFSDSTNPDERGLIFQVPWDCKIDALWAHSGSTDANSDYTLKLYSSPLSSPSLIASQAILSEQGFTAAQNSVVFATLASEVSLSKNTDYIIALLATGSTNSRVFIATVGNTAHRAAYPGGTTLKKATRNNSAGDFAAESPAITLYNMGVRISSFDDGTGAGSSPMQRSLVLDRGTPY